MVMMTLTSNLIFSKIILAMMNTTIMMVTTLNKIMKLHDAHSKSIS